MSFAEVDTHIMYKTRLFFGYICLSCLVVGVFYVKHTVLNKEKVLQNIHNDIKYLSEDVHMLNGEWAVLTEPSRLALLSQKILKMAPITGEHYK